jgi:hypothetical protein
MAKDNPTPASVQPATIPVPAEVFQQMQARLEALEQMQRMQTEALLNPRANILDKEYEKWKQEAGRPAGERTQDVADKKYGKTAPRFNCRLDSTKEDGKPGPHIDEHPTLTISANSEHEAQGRYLELIGVTKHDYRLVAEPVAA